MSEVKCCGDCRKCVPLSEGKVDTSRCASQWGFVHIVEMYREMRTMHTDLMDKLNDIGIKQDNKCGDAYATPLFDGPIPPEKECEKSSKEEKESDKEKSTRTEIQDISESGPADE